METLENVVFGKMRLTQQLLIKTFVGMSFLSILCVWRGVCVNEVLCCFYI